MTQSAGNGSGLFLKTGPVRTSLRMMAGVLMSALAIGPAFAQTGGDAGRPPPRPCGLSPSDWCIPDRTDPCAVHKDAASCKADAACFGLPYRGESVVACRFDARGFGLNCPTVGCTSKPPRRP
jgi:hypothetical protein